VFCGHPSLRFGAAVHFTLLWGYNALNTIVMIGMLVPETLERTHVLFKVLRLFHASSSYPVLLFVEPDFDPVEVLAPYQPLSAKVTVCPIDTTINFQQGNILIRDLKPAKLVVPHGYTVTPPAMPHRTDLKLEPVRSLPFLFTTFRKL
jgi:hypothetical protein